jgi:hypothetical protein
VNVDEPAIQILDSRGNKRIDLGLAGKGIPQAIFYNENQEFNFILQTSSDFSRMVLTNGREKESLQLYPEEISVSAGGRNFAKCKITKDSIDLFDYNHSVIFSAMRE